MSARKHSYVRFFTSDWIGGTSTMPRLVKSIYFDICCYNWDKAKAMPLGTFQMMVQDTPGDQVEAILQFLLDEDKIVQQGDGSLFSPRAISEADWSFEQWQKRSHGGKNKNTLRMNDGGLGDESSKSDGKPLPKSDPALMASNNQNQNHKKKEANASQKEEVVPEDDSDADALAKVRAAQARADAIRREQAEGAAAIVNAWNAMAAANGLSQISKMTDERSKRAKARVQDHTADTIIEWIAKIPESPFLRGNNDRKWKANFDWLVQPGSCAKLIEGAYHNTGDGRESGWR